MFSPSRLSSHFLLLFLLLVSVSVNGLPTGSQHAVREVVRRQAYSGPQTVQQVTTSQTPQGTVVTTCEVTLTPTKDANGQDQVLEVKQCTVALVGSSVSSTDSSSATSTSVTATTTDSSSTATSTSSSTDSTVSSTASTSSSAAISVDPVTSVSASLSASSASETAPSTSSTSAASSSTGGASSSSGTPSATSVTSAGAASSGTAAAENASTSPAPFAIPGKKLQVLPIGLGVFAGISVIALIVVALVTYERTKYRRAFRKNRLREQAAPMGYGGMAQRDP